MDRIADEEIALPLLQVEFSLTWRFGCTSLPLMEHFEDSTTMCYVTKRLCAMQFPQVCSQTSLKFDIEHRSGVRHFMRAQIPACCLHMPLLDRNPAFYKITHHWPRVPTLYKVGKASVQIARQAPYYNTRHHGSGTMISSSSSSLSRLYSIKHQVHFESILRAPALSMLEYSMSTRKR